MLVLFKSPVYKMFVIKAGGRGGGAVEVSACMQSATVSFLKRPPGVHQRFSGGKAGGLQIGRSVFRSRLLQASCGVCE